MPYVIATMCAPFASLLIVFILTLMLGVDPFWCVVGFLIFWAAIHGNITTVQKLSARNKRASEKKDADARLPKKDEDGPMSGDL